MISFFRLGLLLSPLLGQQHAFRIRKRIKSSSDGARNETVYLDGNCASLYTWGCPMVMQRPHANPRREDGCWQGLRMYNINNKRDWDEWKVTNVDIVPAVLHGSGWTGHPRIGVARINEEGIVQEKPCPGKFWAFETPSLALHKVNVYVGRWGSAVGDYEWIRTLSNIAIRPSYLYGVEEVAAYIKPYGWNIVGSAHENEKVSHLLQDPTTLDCVITFQGTDKPLDWWDNLQFKTAPFCGLPVSVHQGFRSQTRWMTQCEEWQTNIRSKLGKCRSVIATGHSLGGAMATLFTMCIAEAPPPSHPAYFDFEALGWHQETPQLLKRLGWGVPSTNPSYDA